MSWTAIAKKDFRDARRSKKIWAIGGVFLLLLALILLSSPTDGPNATTGPMTQVVGISMFLLPLAVLVMTYHSITGERESGSIKYLLGLPATRFEAVVGKFVARSLVAGLGIFVALVGGAVIMRFHFGALPVVEYTKLGLLTLYFTVVWAGIGVGLSALSRTRGQALVGTLGIYFVFGVMWLTSFLNPEESVAYVVEDLFSLDPIPGLYDFVAHLSPAFAYGTANYELAIDEASRMPLDGYYGSELPFYLSDWFMLVILLAWLVVPLGLGYFRFRDAELG